MSSEYYQDTIVGLMPNEWKVYSVEQLIENKIIEPPLDGNHGEIHPKQSDYVRDGIPFVMASDITNGQIDLKYCKFISLDQAKKLRKGFSKAGDVLLTHKATIGRCCVVPNVLHDFIVLTPQVTYYRIIDTGKINNQFLRYYFEYEGFQYLLIAWSGGGSTRAYIGITAQRKLPVVLPPISEQRAIAAILSALDDKIELNNRINKTLEEMAQALFKQWFVEFEFPDENGQPYKSSGGEMEESELGLIPKGWKAIAFNDFLVERKEKTGERDIPEYSSTNDGLFPRSEKFKKQLSVSQSSNKVIIKNDLVFGMSRQILNWGIMLEEVGAVSAAYHVFEVNQALVNSKFLELLMKNRISYFMDIIKPAAREGQGIDKSALRKKTIYTPPRNVFEQFQYANMCLQETIKLKTNEINNLTSLRDALLPKLMSGEIRVPIEEVAADV